MSTYLQLFQQAKRDCRISGSAPTTVSGNTGVLDRLVNWVSDAYIDLQNRADWRWLRHEFTCTTAADDGIYAYGDCTDVETSSAITRFSHWWLHDQDMPSRIYLSSDGVAGEYWMSYTTWPYFKSVYMIGTEVSGTPAIVSVDPLDRMRIGQRPDGVYVLTGDYQMSAQILSSDSDTPELPTQFHQLIVYLAMQKYGYIEGSPEVLMRGQTEGNRMMRQLEGNQLPQMRLGGPMA